MASNASSSNTQWESYSDFATVTRRVADSIGDAIDAYARIRGRHAEGAPVQPQLAAEARGRILAAALRLLVELEQNAPDDATPDDNEYAAILARWQGENGDDRGFIQQFDDVELQEECPDWLGQWIRDIRTAGWQLGYLRAGETKKQRPDDPEEAQAEAMLDDMP